MNFKNTGKVLFKFSLIRVVCSLALNVTLAQGPGAAETTLPGTVYAGAYRTSHLQGMAIDHNYQHMYFSFTSMLVKTDMQGKVIGSVTGIIGHLGDLAFYQGRVFGSLEYKKDNAFYIAVFDVEKITKAGIFYQDGGVMTTMYLGEVSKDFTDTVVREGITQKHRYGCSGIDGVTFGTVPGSTSDKMKMMVAYGIFSDTTRSDNDYQVLLQYDLSAIDLNNQSAFNPNSPQTNGLQHEAKYFVYTGNTRYGVQNLEYDRDTRGYWMAVYIGEKTTFPNYPLYLIDGTIAPVKGVISGQEPKETGLLLTLAKEGVLHEASGVYGFPSIQGNPATGFISLGNNYFYISESGKIKQDAVSKQYGYAHLFQLDRERNLFEVKSDTPSSALAR
ncbi:MAG: hypothetical protein PHO37_08485 [Kiritimatiellae bacterium]|nr:hypothetical protein [Kiritimatiellia bacterium]